MLSPWQLIPAGLVLGLIPPRLFYDSHYRHVSLLDAVTTGKMRTVGTDGSGRRRRSWWKLPLLWIDPIRGFLCAHLIALGLYRMPMYNSELIAIILGISGLSTLTVLIVQMEFGRNRTGCLLAPVAFLLGYNTGMLIDLELLGASIAIIGICTMVSSKNFTMGYCVAGAAALLIGYSFLGLSANLAIFALTSSAPVTYAFIRRARLMVPLRS
jgi:hypothetical protein